MIAAGHTGVNASSRLRFSTRLIFFARWLAPELWEHQQ